LKQKRKMKHPLDFHTKARRVVEALEMESGGPAKIVGIRQVNVVGYVNTRPGRPTRWTGYAARRPCRRAVPLAVPMQSRSAVVVDGERPATMLVFNQHDRESNTAVPASTIVAGASAVPSAIETVLSQPCRHPNEVASVFNTVVTGRIEAPGLTLETLRGHAQSIVTKKFPGECAHHSVHT
jgi:hypothetical protein